jgi:hypothetical protein
MDENTPADQPQTPPTPVQNQPVAETQPVPAEPVVETPTDQPVKNVNPLLKRIDTLMGMGIIGISLAGTLLAVALFANPY